MQKERVDLRILEKERCEFSWFSLKPFPNDWLHCPKLQSRGWGFPAACWVSGPQRASKYFVLQGFSTRRDRNAVRLLGQWHFSCFCSDFKLWLVQLLEAGLENLARSQLSGGRWGSLGWGWGRVEFWALSTFSLWTFWFCEDAHLLAMASWISDSQTYPTRQSGKWWAEGPLSPGNLFPLSLIGTRIEGEFNLKHTWPVLSLETWSFSFDYLLARGVPGLPQPQNCVSPSIWSFIWTFPGWWCPPNELLAWMELWKNLLTFLMENPTSKKTKIPENVGKREVPAGDVGPYLLTTSSLSHLPVENPT